MTTELITGHEGAAHVSSADVGQYNAGVIGSGRYVLDTGAQLACEVISANQVSIGTGDAIFDGRHVRVSASENVSIDNGAQGVNRHDIVCFKYEYNAGTDVESVSLAVVKGTAAATATDPEIPSGNILESSNVAYMPLWRIVIEGITVGTPEKLFGDVLVSLDEMMTHVWDVSQIPNLSGDKITSGTVDAARIGNLPASKIASGTLDTERIPNLDASKITTGTLAADRVASLPASKIGSGTLDAARIPSLDASKIGSGTLNSARIPSLDASKIGSGTLSADRVPSLPASKIGSGTIASARLLTRNWTYLKGSAGSNPHVRYCMIAGIVFIEAFYSGTGNFPADSQVALGTLPAGYRPSSEVDTPAYLGADNGSHVGVLWVESNGNIYGKALTITSTFFYGSISFPVL